MKTIGPIQPACGVCRFSQETRNPQNQLQRVLVCKWGPPGMFFANTTGGGVGAHPIWPPVPPDAWCHRFESIDNESANN